MRKTLISLGFIAILVGCGTQADPRLQVNAELRAKCPDFSDDELNVMLQVAEDDRLAGVPIATHIQALGECNGLTISFEDCKTCVLGVLNQVYGL